MDYDMNLKMPWKDICVPVFIKTHVFFFAYQSNFINSPLTPYPFFSFPLSTVNKNR